MSVVIEIADVLAEQRLSLPAQNLFRVTKTPQLIAFLLLKQQCKELLGVAGIEATLSSRARKPPELLRAGIVESLSESPCTALTFSVTAHLCLRKLLFRSVLHSDVR